MKPAFRTALLRGYTDKYGKYGTHLQGKVILIHNQYVFYRDIKKNHSRLFRDNTWNMDHIVYGWLHEHEVEQIYYKHAGKIYKTTLTKIENSLQRGDSYEEKLNNHTQEFIDRDIFNLCDSKETAEVNRKASIFISTETNVAETDMSDKKAGIDPSVLLRLANSFRSAEATGKPTPTRAVSNKRGFTSLTDTSEGTQLNLL